MSNPEKRPTEDKMDLDEAGTSGTKRIKIDKTYLSSVYKAIKEIMDVLAPSANYRIDHNCRVMGSLAISLLWNPEQSFKTKYQLMKLSEDNARIELYSHTVQFAEAGARISEIQQTLDPIHLFPILMLIQNATKTWDSLLYHKNTISKDLGLPAWSEILANSKTIANKLKKARPLAVGPLVHIQALRNLFTVDTKKGKLSAETLAKIRKRHIEALKRQLIADSQRKIVDQFANNNFENLTILVLSMAAIKPHIEHFYCLTPEIIYNATNLNEADMFSRWSYLKIVEANGRLIKVCPRGWQGIYDQLLFHCIYQTWKDNLMVINWATGMNFTERSRWGKPTKPTLENFEIGTYNITIGYFSKPQRGAARNLGVSQSQQLFSIPTMKGKRPTINHFSDIGEMNKRLQPPTANILEQLQADFKLFSEIRLEGTGEWTNSLGSPVECNVTDYLYFFGTPTMM